MLGALPRLHFLSCRALAGGSLLGGLPRLPGAPRPQLVQDLIRAPATLSPHSALPSLPTVTVTVLRARWSPDDEKEVLLRPPVHSLVSWLGIHSGRCCGDLKEAGFTVPGPVGSSKGGESPAPGPDCLGLNSDAASPLMLGRMTSLSCASVSSSVNWECRTGFCADETAWSIRTFPRAWHMLPVRSQCGRCWVCMAFLHIQLLQAL